MATACRRIAQSAVDRADPFPTVLARHTAWLASHGLLDHEEALCFVLCGDWDLGTMLPVQARACAPPLSTLPRHLRRWMNIKRPFAVHAEMDRAPGMAGMLAHLGLPLEGTHHRGIDDCRNIARILAALGEAGVELAPTSKVSPSRYPPVALVLRDTDGTVRDVVLKKRAMETLLGLAGEQFRRRIREVRDAGGEAVTDDDLADLTGGETLIVS